jgi:membrane peptidoglycan carboxypeptidase
MRSTTRAASRLVALLAAFLGVSVVAGVLSAGLFLPAVGATGRATQIGVDWFDNIDPTLETPPLSQGSIMYANDGKTVIAKFYEENRVVTSLAKVAPAMKQAVVAIEDSRFYEHGGIDARGLFRAFTSNLLNDKVQGASTLTQQYIKNVLLETAVAAGDKEAQKAATAKDSKRKIKEIRMAIEYEKHHTKNEILEGYLNIANFGSNNYGVEAASQFYFQTSAAKLTLPQAAMLAGIVQNPVAFNPYDKTKTKATKVRRDTVLARMAELGMITATQKTAAEAVALPTKKQPALSGCITANYYAYFCQYALNSLLLDSRYSALGKDYTTRLNTVRRGGLKIISTMDARLQKATIDLTMKAISPGDDSNVAAAATTVEPGTGKVLAVGQNRVYSNVPKQGQTELNYAVDYKYGGSQGFATGSTFKAFVLADWLATGHGLYDTVSGDITPRQGNEFNCDGAPLAGKWDVHNSEGSGPPTMDIMAATADSVNLAFADMATRLNMCDIARLSETLGAHRAYPSLDVCTKGNPLTTRISGCLPSVILGALSISPMTMASAYAAFAADGMYCPPVGIGSVSDRSAKPLKIPANACTQGVSADVAHGVTYALKGVLRPGGTASNVGGIGWPAAGKTGTADESADTWFVGYTKQRATAVWVADPTPTIDKPGDPLVYQPGQYKLVLGQRPLSPRCIGNWGCRTFYGATVAGPLWKDIMKVAQAGLDAVDWPNPPAKMIAGNGIKVADVTGRSIGEAKAILQGQGFKVKVGKPVHSPFQRDTVASTTPGAGSKVSPGGVVVIHPGDGSQPQPGGGPTPGGNNGGGGGGNGRGNNGGPKTG